MTQTSVDGILEELGASLSPKRLKHVLGVRDTVVEIALRHSLDAREAELAALLHDAAKGMTVEELLALCERYGVPLTDDDRNQPSVLHAYVGAELARERYGAPESVCSAIRAHTTGWSPMSPLDMALYIADFSEPSRPYPEAAEVRRMAQDDLEGATVATMTHKLLRLLEHGALIHPRTVVARNALLSRRLHHEGDV
jgi:predicted HD superfamily hydrolase involved in NAD metabolism